MKTVSSAHSRFEAAAREVWLRLSDGCEIRVLYHAAPAETARGLSLLFIGGWGTIVEGWDFATCEFAKDFDVYYVETREKPSSRLVPAAVNDLDRLSNDMRELVDHFQLAEERLVVFGSSWGGVIAAHALAERKLTPALTVFAAPIGRLGLPPLTRFLVPIAPPAVFDAVRPILRKWLVRSRSATSEQAAIYLRILDNADASKWRAVARHVVHSTFWRFYEQISSPSLIISIASQDNFHTASEAERIAALVKGCRHVSVPTVAEMDSARLVDCLRSYLDEARPTTCPARDVSACHSA